MSQLMPILLSNGATVRIAVDDEAVQDVDVSGKSLPFSDFVGQIRDISTELHRAMDGLHFDKAAVEFGCSATIESGRLLAVIAKAAATATVKVTMEWSRPSTADDGSG